MRVLLVHNRYQQPGGEDLVFESEAALLEAHGHEVHRFTADNRVIRGGGALTAVRAIWNGRAYHDLRALLRSFRPDVVHFHNTFPLLSPAVYYAARECGVPVVQTLHNYRLLCPGATFWREGRVCEDCLGKTPPWPGVLRGCYRQSRAATGATAAMLAVHRWLGTWRDKVDVYIALSEFSKRKYMEGQLPLEKIVVKPNFMGSHSGIRMDGGDGALFVGRLTTEKGIWTLLRAWRLLKNVPLTIVGDGPLYSQAQSFLNNSCMDWVKLLGHRTHGDVLNEVKGAQFLVFPSEWYENFPLALVEAFSCGVPVIASRLGATAEIVTDGVTGLLFDPGSPESLVEKVEWACTHRSELAQMGRRARAEYEAKYTAERNYDMLMGIYEKAIASKNL